MDAAVRLLKSASASVVTPLDPVSPSVAVLGEERGWRPEASRRPHPVRPRSLLQEGTTGFPALARVAQVTGTHEGRPTDPVEEDALPAFWRMGGALPRGRHRFAVAEYVDWQKWA